MTENHLILVLADSLEAIEAKGEVVPRYFNPRNIFQKITVVSVYSRHTTDGLRSMAGTAAVEFRHVGRPPAWAFTSRRARRRWLHKRIEGFRPLGKCVIRAYGLGSAALVAWCLAEQLRLPLVCSVHGDHDAVRRLRLRSASIRSRPQMFARGILSRQSEKIIASRATEIVAVYESAANYAKSLGARKVTKLANVVSDRILPKTHWQLGTPPRVINVGAQEKGVKEPTMVIKALATKEIHLDVFGNGPYHEAVARTAATVSRDRTRVLGPVMNSELAQMLHEYDVAAFRTFAPEMSKVVIEAGLAGLPIVVNRNAAVPELAGSGVIQVDDTERGWADAIGRLVEDDLYRAETGRTVLEYFGSVFDPAVLEQRHAAIYETYLN